jgi:hypothetical protein
VTVSSSSGHRYEIVVRGRLSRRHEGALDGVTLEPGPGRTALRAELVDQSQLYGLLNRLRDLGMELLSVNPVSEAQNVR